MAALTKKNRTKPTRKKKPAAAKTRAEAKPVTDSPPTSSTAEFPIVAIGASAGGLEAFKKFFATMPANSGMAFVLIPHLDPTHESLMVELLAKQTTMPVTEARQRMTIKPNNVYIIPPNKYLAFKEGRLQLSPPPKQRGPHTAIDFALQSLATDRQEAAIGIILSGTGSHGTLGLKEIKLVGGMVMAQEPRTAQYDAMPRSAVATGLVDYILPPEKMPKALLQYAQHMAEGHQRIIATSSEIAMEGLNIIIALLRARTKRDFRFYRKNMLMRRVHRRMGLLQIHDILKYAAHLRENPEEVNALSKDLLIGVTAFFREPEAFEVLSKQVMPGLMERADPETPIRVWVPGCASGEEAYSIAILLLEQFEIAKKAPSLQIFATDVDDVTLEAARQGIYPASVVSGLAPKRLRRFFVKVDENHYRVSQQLRDPIVFAVQNLIGDAPFSKLDLISCRNVLIYLEPEIQSKIISLFHFALNPDGCLLLGPSESIGRAVDMFDPVSKKWRLYRRIGPVRRELVSIPVLAADKSPLQIARREPRRPAAGFGDMMQKLLLEDFAPAAVLINRNYEILAVQGPVVNYLEFPAGELSKDLLAMSRQGLRAKIRAVCQRAMRDNRLAQDTDVRVKRNGDYLPCNIAARPISEPKEVAGLLLVTFEDNAHVHAQQPPPVPAAEEASLVRQLEEELRSTREDLQTTIEELESSNEELKVSNEEIMSMNEELQSSNEELETSKEELQSLNEELTTVNNQLQDKLEELDKANNDMVNFMAASDIATVFLDTELRIRRFTLSTAKLLHLIASDIGRPFRDFAPKFTDDELGRDCELVIGTLTPIEKEVCGDDDRWYLRRILPYRAANARVEGVVITFVEITKRRRAEQEVRKLNEELEQRIAERTLALQSSEQQIRAVLDAAVDAIITIDAVGTVKIFNKASERMFGYTAEQVLGANVKMLMSSPHREQHDNYLRRFKETGEPHIIGTTRELTACRKDGSIFPIELSVSAVDSLGLYTGIIRDISAQKALQQEVVNIATREQRRIGQELHDGVQQELVGLGLIAKTIKQTLQNAGETPTELIGKLVTGIAQTNEHVRELAHVLVPVEITAGNLMAALADLAKRTAQSHHIICRFECPGAVDIADDLTSTHLFRIAQEGVTNAVKHAHAKTIRVRLEQTKTGLHVAVLDDGIGINTAKRAPARGVGLQIMQHRCALVGGKLTITSKKNGGTQIVCTIPRVAT